MSILEKPSLFQHAKIFFYFLLLLLLFNFFSFQFALCDINFSGGSEEKTHSVSQDD